MYTSTQTHIQAQTLVIIIHIRRSADLHLSKRDLWLVTCIWHLPCALRSGEEAPGALRIWVRVRVKASSTNWSRWRWRRANRAREIKVSRQKNITVKLVPPTVQAHPCLHTHVETHSGVVPQARSASMRIRLTGEMSHLRLHKGRGFRGGLVLTLTKMVTNLALKCLFDSDCHTEWRPNGRKGQNDSCTQ